MRIERRLRRWILRAGVWGVGAGAFTQLSVPAAWAQSLNDGPAPRGPSLLLVNTETRVDAVRFRFTGGSAIPVSRLRRSIAFDGPGPAAGLRRTLDFVPGIKTPELERFSPLTLQKDVARLRRLYRTAGFPDVRVDYDVVLDTAKNWIRLTFLVDQGQPVAVGTVSTRMVEFSAPDGSEAPSTETVLPPSLARDWTRHRRWLTSREGQRFGEQERARLENVTADWFLEHGYPWVEVAVDRSDTTGTTVNIELLVTTGLRARVSNIAVEGHRRLSDRAVRREIPIREGDWYDARRVTAAQSELYELELVNRALGDIAEAQPQDSTVALRFRIEETKPRLVWGRLGWRSEAGVAAEAHWSHRNFFGGARTFTVSTTAETGWAAIEQARGRNLGVSALIRQPYIAHRNVSGTFGPFLRWRDDLRDRSLLFGIETSGIYRRGPLATVTVQHVLSRQRVDDSPQLLPIQELVENGPEPFDPIFVRSVFGINAAYGRFDNRLDPRTGFLVEPSVRVTGPTGVTDVDFFRASIQIVGAIPLTERTGLFLRGSAGRLFPFADSDLREPDARTRAVAGLRGVMFTAGGTADVRGWGVGQVGPKIPQVENDDGTVVVSRQYSPVGGLARLTGSAELGLPFPLLPHPHRMYLFLDAGRVWSPGGLVVPADPELSLDRWALGTGAGVQFTTPVGPIRLGVGYKLNPTRIDLLSPGEVARDLAAGGNLSTLETDGTRRWHIHFSIGRAL